MTTPYFSYGSNCWMPQLTNRCPDAALLGPATAPDHAFGWTTRANGTTRATIRHQNGSRCEGLLFEGVPPEQMDPYEGEGSAYMRMPITVDTPEGRVQAFTYIAFEDGLRAWEGWPRARDINYVLRVVGGRAKHGLTTPGANMIVVYGSLMEGFGNHHHLAQPFGFARKVNDVTLRGLRLLDLGAFPGAVPGEPDDEIRGEAWVVDDETLHGIDQLEGHPTFYRRTPWKVGSFRVETYILQRYRGAADEVPSGCWREWYGQTA